MRVHLCSRKDEAAGESTFERERVSRLRTAITVSLIALVAATPSLAQLAVQPAPEAAQAPGGPITDDEIDEIVVIAERVRGQVQTASAPVLELNEEEELIWYDDRRRCKGVK